MKALNTLLGLLILELGFILMLVIFWASNKGFDFTDESYYVLCLSQVEESPGIFYFQHIMDFFFGWMEPGLVGYRIMRLFLSLLSAVVLADGLRSWMRTFSAEGSIFPDRFLYYLAFSFLSIATSYAIYPQALSYNNITVIFLAFTAGLLLKFHARSITDPSGNSRFIVFILGMAAVLVFFGRFTSGLLLLVFLPAYSFLLLLITGQWRKSWLNQCIWYGLGILFSLLLSSILFKSLFSWFADFFDAVTAVSGHSGEDILDGHIQSVQMMLSELLEHHAVIPFFFLLWVNLKGKILKIPRLGLITFRTGVLGLLIWLVYELTSEGLHHSGVAHMSTAIYFYLTLMLTTAAILLNKDTLVSLTSSSVKVKGVMLLIFSLFIFPFIGSVGTDNDLKFQLLQFTFAWITLMLILLAYVFVRVDKILALGLTFILIAGAFSQTVNGLVSNPYRIPGTLLSQQMDVVLKTGDRLMLDEMTASSILNYEKQLKTIKGYREGDPMVVLNGIPGFIYLAQSGVVSNAWMKIGYNESICYNLKHCKREDLERLVVMAASSASIDADLISCLKERGVIFPEKYLLAGTVNYAYFNLNLNIYVPDYENN